MLVGLEAERELEIVFLFLPEKLTHQSRRPQELIKSPLKSSLIKKSSNTGHELLNTKVSLRK